MQAGKMDRLITIEQATSTRDTVGDAVPTWSTFATVWARKVRSRGTEQFKAERETAEREIRLEIRYLAGLDETMRIRFDGQIFDIEDLEEIGRRAGWTIRAVAKVA